MALPKKLLVATDFSEQGDHAGEVALDWAERFGAELHWVHGVNFLSWFMVDACWCGFSKIGPGPPFRSILENPFRNNTQIFHCYKTFCSAVPCNLQSKTQKL